MQIGGFQRVSLADYPGKICAIVFTRGCNFACPYCHNPELVDPCLYRACLAVEDVYSYLEKRRGKLEAVTITGGEPTLQQDLFAFVRSVKSMGYLIKIDTNGSQPEVLERLLDDKLADYVAMDIKAPLEKYSTITGRADSGKTIRQSIKLIMDSGISYEFRTTIVKDQLDEGDLLAIGDLIKDAQLYALQRYIPTKPLDKSFLDKTTLSGEELASVRRLLENNIKRVVIR